VNKSGTKKKKGAFKANPFFNQSKTEEEKPEESDSNGLWIFI